MPCRNYPQPVGLNYSGKGEFIHLRDGITAYCYATSVIIVFTNLILNKVVDFYNKKM